MMQEPSTSSRPPGCIYRWDLDKTYLRTDFDTLRALLRTALEGAAAKRTVPGAATLLRELRRPWDVGIGASRICFISGSPRQMRRVLTEKLRLDGVEFDEFILKPNLRNMLTGRFRALREQVGYKLPALLAGRSGVPSITREVCFGDDAESDAFIYSLYGDLLARRVARPLLEEILRRAGTYPNDAARTVALFEGLSAAAPAQNSDIVARIFIHLDRRSPLLRFDRYGGRLVPIYNYFQAALVLHQDERLPADAVLRIAIEMVERHDYSFEALRNSTKDLLRRGRLSVASARQLGAFVHSGDFATAYDSLPALGILPSTRQLLRELLHELATLGKESVWRTAQEIPKIDYLVALEQDLPRR